MSDDLLQAITTAASALPEPVKANIFQAIGRLVGAAVDVPVAYLEGKAKAMRDDAAGRSAVSRAAAEAAAARIGASPELTERAVDYYAARMLRQQSVREKVAALAAADLNARPPTGDEAQGAVSEDWLDMFARLAEGRSDEDVQAYFGKLLAEEIRQPGSFSPATMQILATINPPLAKLFQAFCSVTVTVGAVPNMAFVISSPFGAPGDNKLSPFGLSYSQLTQLQSAGLVHTDLTAWRDLPRFLLGSGLSVAKQPVVELLRVEGPQPWLVEAVRASVVNFTPSGHELYRIVHATPNPAYVDGLRAWIRTQLTAPTNNT